MVLQGCHIALQLSLHPRKRVHGTCLSWWPLTGPRFAITNRNRVCTVMGSEDTGFCLKQKLGLAFEWWPPRAVVPSRPA